ncbi:hypothetical protein BHC59_00190 [Snodgrassella alvi]|nr:hypothetical protein BHC59_00190 [Snodgrassella alvi]
MFDQVLSCQFGGTRPYGSGCGIAAVDARTNGAYQGMGYQLRCLILVLFMAELLADQLCRIRCEGV